MKTKPWWQCLLNHTGFFQSGVIQSSSKSDSTYTHLTKSQLHCTNWLNFDKTNTKGASAVKDGKLFYD